LKGFFSSRSILPAIAAIAALIPFINKAFHMDDPLFLWTAQQISQHSRDPFGFSVNWYRTVQPMFSVMQNPPLSSYYMAGAASFLGWSEPAMHGAFLVPAIAAVVGVSVLARRFCGSPSVAALLTLFTPVFLVSATTVMCDVWLLALWVWSIECWLAGLGRNDWRLLAVSAVLAAAATLTKYFGISLVALLTVYTLVRERRCTLRLLFLLLPIFAVTAYEAMTKAKYGVGLFGAATVYSWTFSAKVIEQLPIGLSFAGGCLISALFYAPIILARRKYLIFGALLLAIFCPLFYLLSELRVDSEALRIAVGVEGGLFATVAVGILALTFADLAQRKDADSLLLCLWVLGTFCFAAFFNWSITARTFLPMAPAVAILLIRKADRSKRSSANAVWLPLLPAAVASLLIAGADCQLANTAREASRQFHARFQTERGTVWFEGHWGFHYYAQQWGAKPLDLDNAIPAAGDIVIVPLNNTNLTAVPKDKVASWETAEFSLFPFVVTHAKKTGAGFYSSLRGPLPFAIASVPNERYYLVRVK
jgi:Dolichyl-phosphate-mannose-protein mannosyltransferase